MNPHEQQSAGDAQAARATMSALADGQVDAADAACRLWASDTQARRAWYEYQLIGDALRSDELVGAAARDEAVLHAVRSRLAGEPAIVAPVAGAQAAARPAAASSRRQRWSIAAVAAGFLVVAGVAGLLQREGEDAQIATRAVPLAPQQTLARSAEGVPAQVAQVSRSVPAMAATVAASAGVPAVGEPQWRMLDGKVIRDARLDAYLRAHRGTGAVSGRFETVVLDR